MSLRPAAAALPAVALAASLGACAPPRQASVAGPDARLLRERALRLRGAGEALSFGPDAALDALVARSFAPRRAAPPAPALVQAAFAVSPTLQARQCLAAAVYYEAAREPLEGQRAVAQVVLNRVRDPHYPKSVCGVVYQGWRRATGCQFTFSCDGSLARRPVPALWARAEGVAGEALDGYVAPGLQGAVNYHADYVAPYWKRSVIRIAQIGRHLFYRRREPGDTLLEAVPDAPAVGTGQP